MSSGWFRTERKTARQFMADMTSAIARAEDNAKPEPKPSKMAPRPTYTPNPRVYEVEND